jgi:phage FluMu gp28-like protein
MPEKTPAAPRQKYFLPYQAKWIADPARLKITRKSRRIGMTYAQSYEDVVDASKQSSPMDVWFSSADESAAREYIRYCQQWSKLYKIAAEYLGEIVISKKDDIKALSIEYANGRRVNALSSTPKAFRSKGGKAVLDEFAFHADADALWKAASPVITWGYPIRVLSTLNGQGNRFYRMVTDAEKVGSKWSLHTITIEDAIREGLVSKILGREATKADIASFVEDCRALAGDEETYQQEYMCVAIDETTAWLSWELIVSCEHPDAGKPELYAGGRCYVGYDVARRRDLAVIWVEEEVGDVLWTREVIAMKGRKFAEQFAELDRVFATYDVNRMCVDQTGMGEKVVEDAKLRYGDARVEGLLFTGPVKQDLAVAGKQKFEDKRCRIPAVRSIRESHHSVRKQTTVAGNPRFDADRSEVGHADEFWAHMLSIHAAGQPGQPPAGESIDPRAEDFLAEGMANRRRTTMFRRAH